MTARRFLEKHGLLDAQEYQRRLIEQGNPDAVSVQYPLSELRYRDMGTGQNVLLITVDGLNYSRFEKQMPALAGFAEQNISFTRHMSSGNTTDNGIFGLFYGISPSYMDGILSTRTPAALITALNQQGYQLGLFSSDGFTSPLYRQALLSDFSMPSVRTQSDEQTATQWINWLGRYAQEDNRWFSWSLSMALTLTTAISRHLHGNIAGRQAMSMTRSTACSMHCVILANWTIRW